MYLCMYKPIYIDVNICLYGYVHTYTNLDLLGSRAFIGLTLANKEAADRRDSCRGWVWLPVAPNLRIEGTA